MLHPAFGVLGILASTRMPWRRNQRSARIRKAVVVSLRSSGRTSTWASPFGVALGSMARAPSPSSTAT